MTVPIDAPLDDALAALAATPRLLVALDFDGTLAPEVDDPEAARALPAAHEAVLRLLGAPATAVAYVSGRAMASLEHVAQLPPEALLIGSHGVEVRLGAEGARLDLGDDELAQRDRLLEVLESVAEAAEGAWVERKPAGFALHTRVVARVDAERLQKEARRRVVDEVGDLTVRAGKNVLEFSVRRDTKGDAIDRLRRETSATAVFFAGDDVTDEDGFAHLTPGDVGLKCGDGETRAAHRVAAPDDVAAVLHRLADLRQARAAR